MKRKTIMKGRRKGLLAYEQPEEKKSPPLHRPRVSKLVREALSKASRDLHEEVDEFLSTKGSGFKANYHNNKHTIWEFLSDYISDRKMDDTVDSFIKSRKGEKEVLNLLSNPRISKLASGNTNVMRALVMQKLIMPRIKKKNQPASKTDFNPDFRRNTGDELQDFLKNTKDFKKFMNKAKMKQKMSLYRLFKKHKHRNKLKRKLGHQGTIKIGDFKIKTQGIEEPQNSLHKRKMTQPQENEWMKKRFERQESIANGINPNFWSSERRDARLGSINSPRYDNLNIEDIMMKDLMSLPKKLKNKVKSQDQRKKMQPPLDSNPMFNQMRDKVKEMQNTIKNGRKAFGIDKIPQNLRISLKKKSVGTKRNMYGRKKHFKSEFIDNLSSMLLESSSSSEQSETTSYRESIAQQYKRRHNIGTSYHELPDDILSNFPSMAPIREEKKAKILPKLDISNPGVIIDSESDFDSQSSKQSEASEQRKTLLSPLTKVVAGVKSKSPQPSHKTTFFIHQSGTKGFKRKRRIDTIIKKTEAKRIKRTKFKITRKLVL
ncbi:unnamed protein product [Moneuplotes crassus]|uniref:Uncharacterized protein n=1 Tax=Euplotes crassus TaxID=5936 RepID=A0AAD1U2L6_EUPCR|nr:unnamed protein product [Moneuplotes crassus]